MNVGLCPYSRQCLDFIDINLWSMASFHCVLCRTRLGYGFVGFNYLTVFANHHLHLALLSASHIWNLNLQESVKSVWHLSSFPKWCPSRNPCSKQSATLLCIMMLSFNLCSHWQTDSCPYFSSALGLKLFQVGLGSEIWALKPLSPHGPQNLGSLYSLR